MNARGDSDGPEPEDSPGEAGKAALRPADAWFRSVVEAANEGIWIVDLDARTLFANQRMAAMLGTTPEGMIGQTPFDYLFEEDQGYGAQIMARNFEGVPVEFEIRFRRADGGEIPVLAGSAPLRDDEGRIIGSVATFSDLTDRKSAERALLASEREARESATLFTQLLESSSDAIWLRDPEGRFQIVNPPAAMIIGGCAPADILGRPMAEVWGEEFAAKLRDQSEQLFLSGKAVNVEEEVYDTGRGGPAVFLSNKVPLFHPDGSRLGILGVSRDITELKRNQDELRESKDRLAAQVAELQAAQQREHLLAREVDHRAKNLLAVVQSIVQLSRAESVAELKDGLTGRIQSLGRAHSLLADSRWEGVSIAQLVAEELAPFTGAHSPQVSVSGPPLLLRPSAAQSLALVLHELTTNAAKFGALSVQQGRLELSWRIEASANAEQLVIEWRERGGPERQEPDESGFGSRLITASIERQLRGKALRRWLPEGLHCTFTLPASGTVAVQPPDSAA